MSEPAATIEGIENGRSGLPTNPGEHAFGSPGDGRRADLRSPYGPNPRTGSTTPTENSSKPGTEIPRGLPTAWTCARKGTRNSVYLGPYPECTRLARLTSRARWRSSWIFRRRKPRTSQTGQPCYQDKETVKKNKEGKEEKTAKHAADVYVPTSPHSDMTGTFTSPMATATCNSRYNAKGNTEHLRRKGLTPNDQTACPPTASIGDSRIPPSHAGGGRRETPSAESPRFNFTTFDGKLESINNS